jgi:hypothetical protein
MRPSDDVVADAIRYEVLARDPARVKPELCALWRDNLALACTPEAHFDWLYRDAPDPAPTVFVLCAAAGGSDAAQIVGANGFSIRRFQLGAGVEDRAAVSGDLVVARAHRTLLPALRLIRAVRDHTAAEYAFCYGFPNAKAEGVMARAGFHVLGKTTRYARVLRHASYLPSVAARAGAPRRLTAIMRSAAPLRRLGRALSPAIDVARLAGGLPEIAEAQRRYRLAWTAVDARFDELWARARREYDVIGARTAAVLRWRYPRAEVAALERRADRALVAYAVIERDPATRAAHVRDVFGHKSALGPLFDLLLPAVWWAGAHSISIRLLGAPYLVEVLVERGFEPRGERRTVVVQVGRAHEAARARIESADTWHLLDLDEDT